MSDRSDWFDEVEASQNSGEPHQPGLKAVNLRFSPRATVIEDFQSHKSSVSPPSASGSSPVAVESEIKGNMKFSMDLPGENTSKTPPSSNVDHVKARPAPISSDVNPIISVFEAESSKARETSRKAPSVSSSFTANQGRTARGYPQKRYFSSAPTPSISEVTSAKINTPEPAKPRVNIQPGRGWFSKVQLASKPTIVLDPNGDVILTIRNPENESSLRQERLETVQVQVSLSNLRQMASEASWQEFLGSKAFLKCKAGSLVERDDIASALLFVLKIAHHVSVPENELKFELQDMVDIAVVCDRYDGVAFMRKEFSRHALHFSEQFGSEWYLVSGSEEWLYVAYVFGFCEDFARLLHHLIVSCKTDHDGDLLNVKGAPLHGYFPAGVIEHIKATRETYLDKLLATAYRWKERLLDPVTPDCLSADAHHHCISITCGTFSRELQRVGLSSSKPNVKDVKLSINDLVKLLKDVKTHSYDDLDTASARIHASCLITMMWEELIDQALYGLDKDKVPPEFEKKLLKQAAKGV